MLRAVCFFQARFELFFTLSAWVVYSVHDYFALSRLNLSSFFITVSQSLVAGPVVTCSDAQNVQ